MSSDLAIFESLVKSVNQRDNVEGVPADNELTIRGLLLMLKRRRAIIFRTVAVCFLLAVIRYNVSNDAQQAIKEQVLVNPGDTVVVAKAGIVYILGDVNRPGGYTMNNNESKMSLLEALSNAGGAGKTAKLGHARLIRKSDHTEMKISLGDIEKGKRPDFAMAPGDILYVPFSYAKNLVISSSAGIASAAGTAAVYASH